MDEKSQDPPSNEAPKFNRTAPKYYHLRSFWVIVFIVLVGIGVGILNLALNNHDYQIKAAGFIYKHSQTKIEFNNLHFNLFTGELKGEGLALNVEKIQLALSLKEFKLNYTPLYFLLGRFRITQIEAKEFTLDTSQLVKSKKERKQAPSFLKRINLKEAHIDRFLWKQPKEANIKVESVKLNSKFGSTFDSSPINVKIGKFIYTNPKVELFVDDIDLDGFFLIDVSQPRIVDESKVSIKANFTGILLGIHRAPKPWLSERSYDEDLEPILKKYYPEALPQDKTFLFVQKAGLDFQKTDQGLKLYNFNVDLFGDSLVALGTYSTSTKIADFTIKTESPLPLSKLPLGQSKFRQSFERVDLNTQIKGNFTSLKEHKLGVDVAVKLIGNKVNPPAGDVSGHITGTLTNRILEAHDILAKLSSGQLTGRGTLNLETLVTETSLSAKDLDAQTVIRLFSSVNVPSLINATGSITGKVNNPRMMFNLETNNATYEFLNFGLARGELLIQDKNMTLNVHTTASDIGTAELKLGAKDVFDPFKNNMDLTSKFSNINIKKLLNAKTLDGTIGGIFNLKRVNAKIKADGDFKAIEFSFFDHTIGDLAFKVNQTEKHVEVKPIAIDLVNPKKTITATHGLVFDFDDLGYRFSGNVIEGLKTEGTFKKADRSHLQLKFTAQKMSLDFFTSLLPITPETSSLSGIMDLTYDIQNPIASQMKSNLNEMSILTPDGLIKLNRAGGVDYQSKAFVMRNIDLTVGQGKMLLNGPLGLENNSNLKITGPVDFTPLTDFNPFISESEKPVFVDVTLSGEIKKPRVTGKVELANDSIKFRNIDSDIENMNGTITFNGDRIETKNLTIDYNDALMHFTGWVTTDYQKITAADLALVGKEVPLHPFTGLSLLCDIDINIRGHGLPMISGRVNIVEGQYTRNFSVTNFIVSPEEESYDTERETFAGLPLGSTYNLHFKNIGDLLIHNNLAELEMNAEIDMLGTIESPDLVGQIDFLGGQINAYGIDFDNATGYAQFRRGKGLNPDVSLVAKKEIQGYTINARIEGLADNLRLRLDSSPALDHREILSMIFYGQTPDQLDQDRRRSFTQTAAISQLANILSDPLYKLSGLDVLQVNSRRESSRESIQRLTVGKKLSERFDLSFTTDLGISDPERAFELRYQLFDNFYLIAAKDVVGGDRYRFDVNFTIEAN